MNHVLCTLNATGTNARPKLLPSVSILVSRHLHGCRREGAATIPRLEKVQRQMGRRAPPIPLRLNVKVPCLPLRPPRCLLLLKGCSGLGRLVVGVAGWERPLFPGGPHICPQSRGAIAPILGGLCTYSVQTDSNISFILFLQF